MAWVPRLFYSVLQNKAACIFRNPLFRLVVQQSTGTQRNPAHALWDYTSQPCATPTGACAAQMGHVGTSQAEAIGTESNKQHIRLTTERVKAKHASMPTSSS